MSENITHTAVCDDCLRLMHASDAICDDFKAVAKKHHDFARLGSTTKSGDKFNPGLLESFRGRWAERTEEDGLEQKLAFVLGWLMHRAADRRMKPVFRALDPDCPRKPTDCSVYHDAVIFREVFAGREDSPYHPAIFEKAMASIPAAKGVDLDALKDLFRAVLQSVLIEMHTLAPQGGSVEEIEQWLERLYATRQIIKVDIDRYAAAIHNPDPDMMQRFIIDGNFYDANEPLISCARRIQNDKALGSEEIEQAFAAEAQSEYGKALHIACAYVRAASEFFSGDMPVEELKKHLLIGRKGRDGKWV